MAKATAQYLVTPQGYDNIGAVLDALGEGFAHREVQWDDIAQGIPSGCRVLFVNCGSSDTDPDAAGAVRDFVAAGGSLYASDWAGDVVEQAFPGVLEFDQSGVECTLPCQVADPGLREVIGATLPIHFDLGGWWRVTKWRDGVRVYVAAEGRAACSSWLWPRARTCDLHFLHNEAQVSEQEKELLRFLVLRPILAQAAANAAQTVQALQCVPGKEIIATVDRKAQSALYAYDATGTEGLLFVLSWTESGTLRLVVTDPSGKTVHQADSASSPLRFEANPAVAGRWTCQVEAVNVAHDNFPYVLTLATRGKAAGPSPTPQAVPQPAPGVKALWPCYMAIDCSARASDVAPKIGQGIGTFLKGLKTLAVPGMAPAVSFVECRDQQSAISPLRPLSQLEPINLSCAGEPALSEGLGLLVNAMTAASAGTIGKPFVVLVLAATPAGEGGDAAVRLRQLATDGKLNLVAIGVDSAVSDSMLQQLAPIALRVQVPHSDGAVRCFDWLVRVAETTMRALSQPSAGAAVNLPPRPTGSPGWGSDHLPML